MTETLRIDAGLVLEAGGRLQALAGDIPPPPTSFSPTGGDALSMAIAAKVAEVVEPVIAQLPVVKEDLRKYAQNVMNAANTYESVDRQIAEDILNRVEALDDAARTGGGTAGVSGSPAGGTGDAQQAGQLGSMMQMPMHLAQQAAQAPMQAAGTVGTIPQAMAQSAEQAVQQAGQPTQTEGKGEAPAPSDESPLDEQASAGDTNSERAPLNSSTPDSPRSTEEGPGTAL